MKKYVSFPLPLQLLAVLIFSACAGSYLSLEFKQVAYSISLSIKSGLIFFLPWIIFACIFGALSELGKKGALLTTVVILGMVCISNFISTWIAFSFGQIWIHIFPPASIQLGKAAQSSDLTVLWTLALPHWISNDRALGAGVLLALVLKKPSSLKKVLNQSVHILLNRLFVPLVPLFVLGFSLKLQHDHLLERLFQDYGPIVGLTTGITIVYIFFLYALGARFQWKKGTESLKTVFPSIISGFSTMSSAASMPLTLSAAEKNTGNPAFARTVIPMTANNHLIGDSLFIPLVALMVLMNSQGSLPSPLAYLPFAIHFVLAKFAVAAVPGGGILVMLPILEKYLGLEPEPLSLITTLYILFDPIITSANVAGNGAFAILLGKFFRKKSISQESKLTLH